MNRIIYIKDSLFWIIIMFLKIFICLWTYTLCSTVVAVSSPDVVKLWEEAAKAVKYYWNPEHIISLHNQLKGKIAPPDFLTVHQQEKCKWESTVDFKNRMLIPELLCSVGWEGTLFLMSQTKAFQTYFAQQTPPSSLRSHLTKDCLTQHFVSIEAAATNGQLGAVLCFMHYSSTSNDWQMGFVNGFFNYCQTSGYTDFTKYVFDNNEVFFGRERNNFLYSLQGKCFMAALRKTNPEINAQEELKKFHKIPLNAEYVDEIYQNLVDILYVELAKKELYEGMDIVLDCDSWPQPSSEAKLTALRIVNSTFHEVLMHKNYSKAKAMLARKTENKPVLTVLHAAAAKAAEERSWQTVDDLLANMYDESRPVPQALTDDLFVCAVAYQNHEYFSLLTGENPFAVLTGEEWAYTPPSPAAFDRGLLETVRFRHQDMFDNFLASYSEKLSEAGMKAALEQAGEPKVDGSLYEISASSRFFDNHYEERLKKKLGIPTKCELMYPSNMQYLEMYFAAITPTIEADASSFFVPVTEAANSSSAKAGAEESLPT